MGRHFLPMAIMLLSFVPLAGLAATSGSADSGVSQQTAAPHQSALSQIKAMEAQVDALEQRQSGGLSSWTQRLHFHGFATFGLTRSDFHNDNVTYAPRASTDGVYPGVGDKWNWRSLSRAGLQVKADLGHDTQLVTQFLARGSTDYDVSLQWAYISHDITPNLSIRAGQLVLPFYMHSEYYDVAYAYPWPRLPDEVYQTVPGDTAEGAGITWNFTTGPVAYTLDLSWTNTDIYQAAYVAPGQPGGHGSPSPVAYNNDYHVQNQINGSFIASWQALKIRLGYSGGKVDLTSPLSRAMHQDVNPIPADALDIDHEYAYFANAGFHYDDGRFLLTGEWAQLDVNGYFPLTRSSYVTAGVHFGRWLPLVTFGRLDTSDSEKSRLPVLGIVGRKNQRRGAIGVRYDVTSHVDLKAEFSHINGTEGTTGWFSLPTHLDDGDANIMRFSVDAVF